MKLEYPFGATPHHIMLQAELNEWEEANILQAHLWLAQKQRMFELQTEFCKALHQHMFNKTWKWAGKFRQSDKNIGVDWRTIPVALYDLFQDVTVQIDHQSFTVDEIAARFHHRLVFIHPFSNGNGRHARLMTDLLLKSQQVKPFSWGAINLTEMSTTRKAYIDALRAADKHNYQLLLDFVRS